MTRGAIRSRLRRGGAAGRTRQKGVVLFISLIVLVAMSLAGVALVRSVDTGLGIAGNMAFKQASIQGSDRGVAAAYNWLLANSAGGALQNSNAAAGYYSSHPGSEPNWFDIANWPDGAVVTLDGGVPDAAGNVVRYVIHRMCTQPNTPYNGYNAGVPNQCALRTGAEIADSKTEDQLPVEAPPQLYYRITTRVDGPRNTVSVIQVFVVVQV